MRISKILNRVNRNFRSYKMSYTMFLFGLSATLSILGSIYGMLFLVLANIPILAWGILYTNNRQNTEL
ncbi:MAG: hypothetical protein N2B06_18785 [Clostridium sp.]